MKRKIELLSPARTADIGLEAIRHGADAVYIGPPQFGARSAAGNSIEDIHRLCDYAHLFDARVYVAFNTILYDEELSTAEKMIHSLYQAGADALIVQDTSVLRMELPPIALHASTQMDVTTADKARFLARIGFSQIVLARELSLAQIKSIRTTTNVVLEAFVHGALCVSYSGRCYASQACFGRSANRGRCAQFCRLPFDLTDAEGKNIEKNKHLLSLKDMNRTESVEEMMDAGVSSFKIEGRLKDVDYVKNITAHYRQVLDEILTRRGDEYERSSHGASRINFEPRPEKSFNRGFTDYFLHGRKKIHCFDSPKSKGEFAGSVSSVGSKSFTIKGATQELRAGDGLCYVDERGNMNGMRVNRVNGTEIFPANMPKMRCGQRLYRNLDYAFVKKLEGPTAERRLRLRIKWEDVAGGFLLQAQDESGRNVENRYAYPKESARTPQEDNIRRILSKCGNTPFSVESVTISMSRSYFIPSSVLSEWRRQLVEMLLEKHRSTYVRPSRRATCEEKTDYMTERIGYEGNVSNESARKFYVEHGVKQVEPAFELSTPSSAVLMTCKHCIRYALGFCPRFHQTALPWAEPLSLRLADGRRFPLQFDCKSCEMKVLINEK